MKPENFDIINYKFRPDGTLDVFESVFLLHKNLIELPFKFGEVDGDFNCSFNLLTSLKGAPKIVKGNFYCSDNKLTSLKDTPETIYGNFWCGWNNLTNFKNFPNIIKKNFSGQNVKLKSLEGLNLNKINGKIDLKYNPNLKLTEKEKLWATLNPGRLIL